MAAEAGIVIFVVPGSGQIDQVLDAMLAKAGQDLIIWDFTTSGPVYTRQFAARAADAGMEDEDFTRIYPTLDRLAEKYT